MTDHRPPLPPHLQSGSGADARNGGADHPAEASDAHLDALFADARAQAAPQPSARVMARILADADRLQPRPVVAGPPTPVGRRAGMNHGQGWASTLARAAARLWPDLAPVGGVGLAALAGGLWLGLAAPDLVAPLLPAVQSSVELFPNDGDVIADFALFQEG